MFKIKALHLRHSKAYTLIELLLVLLLLAVLFCITLPGWQLLLQNNTAKAHGNRIITALEYTRILAIKQNKNIAFCRKDFADGKNSKDWSRGQVVVSMEETKSTSTLYVFAAVPKTDRLIWVSNFDKNNCIEFSPLGVLEGQQGSFYYCYGKKSQAQVQYSGLKIVVQETGNIYIDGVVECPAFLPAIH